MEKAERIFTLVVADDELLIRKGISENMPWADIGVQLVAAEADGEAAFAAIERLRPDLAIVDICMPRCDGLTLIERVREAGLPTECIILSGFEDFTYAKRAMKYGVTSYLLKPINKNELLETVRRKCEEIVSRDHRLLRESTLRRQLEESRDVLRERFLENLAAGHLRSREEVLAQMEGLSLSLQFEDVSAVALDFDPARADRLEPLVEGVLWSCGHALFGVQEGTAYLAINARPTPGAQENLRSLLREMIALADGEGLALVCGLGTSAPNLLALPLSYRSAQQALRYKMYELPGGLYDAATIPFTPLQAPVPENMQSDLLAEGILLGNREALEAGLADFFCALFYIEMPPPSFIHGMCAYLVTDVQRRIQPYVKDKQSLAELNVNAQVQTQTTLTALRAWLLDLFLRYSALIATDGLFKHDPIIDKAKQYIDENLLGKLPLSEVASHVHLSESYFASLFRTYTGQSFRKYLQSAKMAKARELLGMDHMSIRDVSEMLGYEDYRAFTRAFKKHTGRRPSEMYRQPGGVGGGP